MKWPKIKRLLPKKLHYDLQEDFRLYNIMLKHGLTTNEICAIFNIESSKLTSKFNPITDKFNSLKNFINEVKINDFIIAKKDHDQDIKSNILSIMLYPLLLVFVLFSLLIIFKIMVIPRLFEMMDLFTANVNDLRYINFIMNLCLWLIIIVFILMVFVFINYQKDKLQLYQWLNTHLKFNIIKEYITLQFCVYFNILLSEGIPTKNIFQLLNHLPDKKIISYITKKATLSLENGIEINEVLEDVDLEKRFIKMFRTGIMTGTLPELLNRYCQLEKTIFLNKLRKNMRLVQYMIYLFIGILVIILYQMLLLPLNTINQL